VPKAGKESRSCVLNVCILKRGALKSLRRQFYVVEELHVKGGEKESIIASFP
jgi:hypothetical protein